MKLRILPALAAMAAALARPFKGKPKKTTIEVPLADLPSRGHRGTRAPSLRGLGKESRALRRLRRRYVSYSFTRFLAMRPVGRGAFGPQGAAWRSAMAGWLQRWEQASANSSTVRYGSRASKRAGRYARALQIAKLKRGVA